MKDLWYLFWYHCNWTDLRRQYSFNWQQVYNVVVFITLLYLLISCDKQESIIPGQVKYCLECETIKHDSLKNCGTLNEMNQLEKQWRDSIELNFCVYKKQKN